MRILFFLLFSLCSCSQSARFSKPLVLVSIPPYSYFVEAIAKDLVEVRSVVPSGVNVHAFEPTPKSMRIAGKAFIWFQVKEGFEPKLTQTIIQKNPSIKLVDLQAGLPLLHSKCSHGQCHKGREDIHTWLDPTLAMLQAKKIYQSLVESFPEKEAFLQRNFRILQASLEDLDQEIGNGLSSLKKRIIVTNHESLLYFTKRYQLTEKTISLEGKEFLPQSLVGLTENIDEIAVVLSFPQFPSKGVKIFAKQYSLPIKMVDLLSENYPAMMKRLSQAIKNGAS